MGQYGPAGVFSCKTGYLTSVWISAMINFVIYGNRGDARLRDVSVRRDFQNVWYVREYGKAGGVAWKRLLLRLRGNTEAVGG